MSKFSSTVRGSLIVVACLLMSRPLLAQGLQVSPISVSFQPGQMAGTLMVTNKTASPVSLQIRPFQWKQPSGSDELTPTTDLAVSPPMTQVAAGQTQTFRLVLRQPAAAGETTYRVLVDQLPPPNTPGAVTVVLRLSIPVFVQAAAQTFTRMDWRVISGRGEAVLVGVNRGGRHVRVLSPVLVDSGGHKLSIDGGSNPYVLQGAERRWPVRAVSPLQAGSTVHLLATSDEGPIDAMVSVSGP